MTPSITKERALEMLKEADKWPGQKRIDMKQVRELVRKHKEKGR